MSRPLLDSDDQKWEYKDYMYRKHEILSKYLKPWIKIVKSVNRNLCYIDAFAGRGEYPLGEKGSPILALEAIKCCLKYFDSFKIFLIEKDLDNFNKLEQAISKETIPNKIQVQTYCDAFDNCFGNILEEIIVKPSFTFLDPFGYNSIPMDLIKTILKLNTNEILITLMVKSIHRFLKDPHHRPAFNRLFGNKTWRGEAFNSPRDIKTYYITQIQEDIPNLCYVDYEIKKNNQRGAYYYLIHFSTHFKAQKIMHDIMFNVGVPGSFCYQTKKSNAKSIESFMDPNGKQKRNHLEKYLLIEFAGQTKTFNEVLEECYNKQKLKEGIYRKTIQEMEKKGKVEIERITSHPKRGGLQDDDKITFPP